MTTKEHKSILMGLALMAAAMPVMNAVNELVRHSFTWADWAVESLAGIIGVAIAGAIIFIGSSIPEKRASKGGNGGKNNLNKKVRQKYNYVSLFNKQ